MEASRNKIRDYYPKGSYVLKVCKNHGGDIQGNIFFPNSSKTISFISAWNMLKQIEEDILNSHFPQSTFELRRWSKRNDKQNKEKRLKAKEAQKYDTVLGNFLIQVQYCQNATWQGSIHWMEGRQTKSFRSQFEMLMLIEEATQSI